MQYFSLKECERAPMTEDWFQPNLLSSEAQRYVSLQFDPESTQWILEAGPYVGIVPLNADFGIQILPKSGLKNLSYMLYRSGLLNRSLETPFDETVPYQLPEDDLQSFFEGLILSFLQAMDVVKAWGLIRESAVELSASYTMKGKLNRLQWTRDLPRTGGLPIPQRIFRSKFDNLPNRVLHNCLDYLARIELRFIDKRAVLGRLDYFGQLSISRTTEQDLVDLERLLETGRFPASRYYYVPALNLALLIARSAGLTLGERSDVVFKPILINMAYMFEKYIRTICQEAVEELGARAEDGKVLPIPFYSDAVRPIFVQPDVVVKRGGTTLLVADVKYKFGPTPQDHYQMWAYMNVHQVYRAGFISVVEPRTMLRVNPTRSRRADFEVFDYAFDCSRAKDAETQLRRLVVDLVRIRYS